MLWAFVDCPVSAPRASVAEFTGAPQALKAPPRCGAKSFRHKGIVVEDPELLLSFGSLQNVCLSPVGLESVVVGQHPQHPLLPIVQPFPLNQSLHVGFGGPPRPSHSEADVAQRVHSSLERAARVHWSRQADYSERGDLQGSNGGKDVQEVGTGPRLKFQEIWALENTKGKRQPNVEATASVIHHSPPLLPMSCLRVDESLSRYRALLEPQRKLLALAGPALDQAIL